MKKIGITGNIGSGKSLVCSIFEVLKVPVFFADKEAKKLYGNPDVYEKMVKYFGKSMYNSNKEIKTKVLAKKIFNQPEAMHFVNSVIHPALHHRFESWAADLQSKPYILYEAAILYETGYDKELDGMIVVTAPEHTRIERIMQRDKLSLKEIKSRIARQWPEEKKILLADFVIQNEGKSLLIPQVLKIHRDVINEISKQNSHF
jgi:dephospho-CoA kinase